MTSEPAPRRARQPRRPVRRSTPTFDQFHCAFEVPLADQEARIFETNTTVHRLQSLPRLFSPSAVSCCGDMRLPRDIAVGLPVSNQGERIVACIDAPAATLDRFPRSGVVVLVNNSVDASARRAF